MSFATTLRRTRNNNRVRDAHAVFGTPVRCRRASEANDGRGHGRSNGSCRRAPGRVRAARLAASRADAGSARRSGGRTGRQRDRRRRRLRARRRQQRARRRLLARPGHVAPPPRPAGVGRPRHGRGGQRTALRARRLRPSARQAPERVGPLTRWRLARPAAAPGAARRGRSGRRPRPAVRHRRGGAAGGRLYALAGRKAGFDTNTTIFESLAPSARRWRTLPPVPTPRGGTGAAVVDRTIVSVGGEAPHGTIATVYGFDLSRRRWRPLPDLPTARHGLGVVAAAGRVYAIAGGTTPGLATSGANEFLLLR